MFVLVLLVGACQQPIGNTQPAASADATTAGDAQTTAAEPTTGGVSTRAEASTADGGSSGDTGSEFGGECPDLEDPTSEINPQVVEECDALCAQYQECGLKDHELCQMGCVAKFGVDHEECYEAGSAARQCLTAMTCEQLGEYLQFNAGGPCAQLLELQHKECTCQSTTISYVGDDACAYNLNCPYLPFRQIYCHQGTCECLVGDDVVKTCPQGDTCQVSFGVYDEAESCCCMAR